MSEVKRDLADVVDEWFRREREDRQPDGLLHPSSMSGCWRQAVYEARGVGASDERDVRNDRIMWFGTGIHEVIQSALGGLPDFQPEVEVAPAGWPTTGHADALWGYDETHEGIVYELIELKSISPFAFKKKDLPREHHEAQARMYVWGLNKMGYYVPRARIVYLSRDDMAMREFVIERDREWEEEYEAKLTVSKALYLNEGQTALPPRLDKDAWLCGYCLFRTRCWEKDDETRQVA